MKIFVNVESRQLQTAVGDSRQVSTLAFKRGDGASVEIIFVRDGVQVELTSGSIVTFGAKLSGKYDANALVLENGFALSGSGSTASYIGAPSFNTVDLDAALEKDGDDTNDVPYLDLMGEISWTDGPTGEPTSTETFTVRVNNDVLRGDEVGPVDITGGTPVNSSLTITGTLTDGSVSVVFPTLVWGGIEDSHNFWSSDGTFGATNGYQCYHADGQWTLEKNVSSASTARWTSGADFDHPVDVITWTPDPSGPSDATGTPTVTETVTAGLLGSMKIDSSYLYVVASVTDGVPLWKKIALSAL